MDFDYSKYPERKYLKRSNQPKYMGWPFANTRPELYETKFCNDNKYDGVNYPYFRRL